MDIPTIETILLIFYLSPGFTILYIFQSARGNKFNSNGEFVAYSVFLNGLVYGIALLISSIFAKRIPTPDELPTLIQTLSFITAIFLAWIITFFLCAGIYRLDVSKLLQKIIKRPDETGTYTFGKELWEGVFQKYRSYILVYTMDKTIYFGWAGGISQTGEQKQLHLKEPTLMKNGIEVPIIDELGLPVKSILFLEKDIKRIAFVGE